MFKIKKIISLILTICILTSCGKENDTNDVVTDIEIDKSEINLEYTINPSGVMMVYSSNTGTYYVSNENAAIGYYDDETKFQSVLCNQPSCTHSDNTCNAYIGVPSYGLFMNPSQDKLFVSYMSDLRTDKGENILSIDVMDYNGENKKNIFKDMGEALERGFVFEGDNLYFFTSKVANAQDSNSPEISLEYYLMKLNYITGKSEIIEKFDTRYSIVGGYNENIVLAVGTTSYYGDDGSLYQYNIKTNTVSLLKDNIGGTGTGAFVHKEYMYIFDRNSDDTAKMIQKNLITNEEKIISEKVTYFGTHSNSICLINFFDNYALIYSSLPPDGEDLQLNDKTYAVNLDTGEEIFIDLNNGYQDYQYMGSMNNSVVLFYDAEETSITLTDEKTGLKQNIIVSMPKHKVISKGNYLISIDEGIDLCLK